MDVLFEKEYFGFIESAEEYVWKIRDFIEENISTYPTKKTPFGLLQYGEKYLTYKANQSTTWYIFFSKIEETFFVKFITNNHTSLSAELNIDY
ncbi:MAG: hypothetical protein PW786_15255 [Arachidicoccus sp.]|nr:hypothetical protein [Arachidicoccus sp.]